MTQPIVTNEMLEIALDIIMPKIICGTFDRGDLRKAIKKSIAAMPPIKLPQTYIYAITPGRRVRCTRSKLGAHINKAQVKKSIEAAGLRWSEE